MSSCDSQASQIIHFLDDLERLDGLVAHTGDVRGVYYLQRLYTAIQTCPMALDAVPNARERILNIGKKHLAEQIAFEGSGHVSDLTLEHIRDPENPVGKWLRGSLECAYEEIDTYLYELAITYLMKLLVLL